MSLINDALKRANQAQKKTPHAAPNTTVLEPAGSLPQPKSSRLPIVIGVILAVVGISFFFWKGEKSDPNLPPKSDTPAATASAVQPPVEVAKPVPVPAQKATETAKPSPLPAVPPINEAPQIVAQPVVATPAPTPVTTPPPAPVTRAATKPPGGFPELKLQGVFFRLNNPSAMISGESVVVGDVVQDVKIVQIERTSVTLEFKGERRTLKLK